MSSQLNEKKPSEIELDDEPVSKRIGLIVLSTDHASEREFARLCDPNEVGVYVTRIQYDNPTTPDNLLLTGPRLSEATALLLPDERFDVIAYGCTAASVVLGNDKITQLIQDVKPEAACVTPSSAAFAAFAALGVKRVSVLTPYSAEVTQELVTYFEKHDLDVINHKGLGFTDDRQMARIKTTEIITAGIETMDGDAEALFISCTALQAVVCVDELERRIGKPVVTSNQAVVWQCQRLAGIDKKIDGFGKLFTL